MLARALTRSLPLSLALHPRGRYKHLQARLDVFWVGCLPMHVPDEHQEEVRRQFNERNCYPAFISESETELAEGLWNDVLWPLFHYIPVRRT